MKNVFTAELMRLPGVCRSVPVAGGSTSIWSSNKTWGQLVGAQLGVDAMSCVRAKKLTKQAADLYSQAVEIARHTDALKALREKQKELIQAHAKSVELSARTRLMDFKEAHDNNGRMWRVRRTAAGMQVEPCKVFLPRLRFTGFMHKSTYNYADIGLDDWCLESPQLCSGYRPRVYVPSFNHFMARRDRKERDCTPGGASRIYPFGVMINESLALPWSTFCVITSAEKRALDDSAMAPLRVISKQLIPALTACNILATIGRFIADAYAPAPWAGPAGPAGP
jgi:hypothetical protein